MNDESKKKLGIVVLVLSAVLFVLSTMDFDDGNEYDDSAEQAAILEDGYPESGSSQEARSAYSLKVNYADLDSGESLYTSTVDRYGRALRRLLEQRSGARIGSDRENPTEGEIVANLALRMQNYGGAGAMRGNAATVADEALLTVDVDCYLGSSTWSSQARGRASIVVPTRITDPDSLLPELADELVAKLLENLVSAEGGPLACR